MIYLDEETVSGHLKNFYGYNLKFEDSLLIKHLIYQTETLIKNFCHIKTIPEGAVHPALDYICGRFLKHKIDTGSLTDNEGNPLYSFHAPEASVTMGDVSVSYESGYGAVAGDNAFLAMVNELADEKNFKLKIVHFRKVSGC